MSKILLKAWNVLPASKIINYGINNKMNTNLVNISKKYFNF